MSGRYILVDEQTGEVVRRDSDVMRIVRILLLIALVGAAVLSYDAVKGERERTARAVEIALEYRKIYEEVKPYSTTESGKVSIFRGNSENYKSVQWSCDRRKEDLDAQITDIWPEASVPEDKPVEGALDRMRESVGK